MATHCNKCDCITCGSYYCESCKRTEIGGWVITKDHIDTDQVGTNGPSDCMYTVEEITALGIPFKLFDDDGELYYEGRWMDNGDHDPLTDFGMGYAGCTRMDARDRKTGSWECVIA